MPFFRNSGMLAHQYTAWSAYPEDLKAQIEIVVVEDVADLSAEHAEDVPRPDGLPPLRIFRILPTKKMTDPPWRQHACRNRGVKEAVGPWLFLTDMDHVMPAESLRALLGRLDMAQPHQVFTFFRRDAPHLTPTLNDYGGLKPHVNTFALTQDYFWQVGGYDEDCVGYGTDNYFRRRLFETHEAIHLSDIAIIRYPREVITDASTYQDGVDPRTLRNNGRRRAETKKRLMRKLHRHEPIKVLALPWERVL
jgi:hypothetical protein